MGKKYSWTEVVDVAAESFGGYPNGETEQALLEVFRERPVLVVDAIEQIKVGFAAGRIHSPWRLLEKNVTRRPANVTVRDDSERERRIQNAESWLHNAGLHIDRESEVADELFGDTGRLRRWGTDEALKRRLLALWQELRPLGEQIEREALERAEQNVETRRRAAASIKSKREVTT